METMYERAFADPEGFGVGLSEYIALGDWRLFFYGRDKTKDVTAQQADSAADKYFVRDNRVVGLFIPDDNPQRAEITELRARMNCWLITSRRELLKRLRLSTLRSITSTRGHSVLISAI